VGCGRCKWRSKARNYNGSVSGNRNGCPVPLCGTGRYKINDNRKVKDARLRGKSRRLLQIQKQRQRRPAKAGRYRVKTRDRAI
jgi:hypothetical protein